MFRSRLMRKCIAYLFVLVIASGLPLHTVQAAALTEPKGNAILKESRVMLIVSKALNDSVSTFTPLVDQAYKQYINQTERIRQAKLEKARLAKQKAAAKQKAEAQAELTRQQAEAQAEKAKLAAKTVSERDLNLLARIVYAESRGEPLLGQIAVAAVVLNRVDAKGFPNTIEGVIEQPRAFSAVDDGQYNLQPDSNAYEAAKQALAGKDPTGGALYYFNPETATSKWIWSRQRTVQIGRHIFAK